MTAHRTNAIDWLNVPVGGSADGRPRLLGELMLSRAIGDLPYRNLGLTAEPEFSPWRNVSEGENLSVHGMAAMP